MALYLVRPQEHRENGRPLDRTKEKAIPTIESVQSFITEVRPRIDTISSNVAESSTLSSTNLSGSTPPSPMLSIARACK